MAKSIMNKNVLANKILALELVLEDKNASEGAKDKAREDMDTLISEICQLPDGPSLLMQVNSIIEKKLKT